ncbi:MAG: PQQ-dependent sugar dehydrogenase, partial [Thermoanaerobaculia bacterium]|nr:PQQ-dependent sugar dehydrogenase [Thermoanaerobaculia bacterium]
TSSKLGARASGDAANLVETHCTPGPTTLCLAQNRLRVETRWQGIDGTQPEQLVPARTLADQSGLFWFFEPTNPEIVVKVVDGRGYNHAFWIFAAPITSLSYDLVVTDTGSGRVRTYPHESFSPDVLVDTGAFVESPHAPLAPQITQPDRDGAVIGGFDVHLETAAMVDPDPGDTHYCSEYEIWTADGSPLERRDEVWRADCLGGPGLTRARLADGEWEGPRSDYRFLEFQRPYILRVRHRDSTGVWSPWTERSFSTDVELHIFPFRLAVVGSSVAWLDDQGGPIDLPVSGPRPSLSIETADGIPLGHWEATHQPGNHFIPGLELTDPQPVRVTVTNPGSTPLLLPPSALHLVELPPDAVNDTIFLPQLNVAANHQVSFWVADNGSTFNATSGQSAPNFDQLARYLPQPWKLRVPGYAIEPVAEDLQFPVNLVFRPTDSPTAADVLLYTTELFGSVWIVRQDGSRELFVDGLLDFDPLSDFPSRGAVGLTGLAVDPNSGDLFVSTVYAVTLSPSEEVFSARVLRLGVDDRGRHDGVIETVLDLAPDTMMSSHQISDLSFGPDGMLYVHQGDGMQPERSHDLHSFLGKILRLHPNGAAPSDNPFYDTSDGIDAADYVYAYGFRNPFAGAWSELLGEMIEAENGPIVDRLARVHRGWSYGWDADQDGHGTNADMSLHASYSWGPPPHAPVGLAFVQPSRFVGSSFPESAQHLGFVTEFGQGYIPGMVTTGKRISAFRFDSDGSLAEAPTPWVEYIGYARSTLLALEAGPDGLYFAEFFIDDPLSTNPVARGSRLWRLRWVGESAP